MEHSIRRPDATIPATAAITGSLGIEIGGGDAERYAALLRPWSLFELELGREFFIVEGADDRPIT